MLRYLNTFTRYMWLMLVPLIVLPIIGASLLTINSTTTAQASLWIEQPLYLGQQRGPDGSGADSPSVQAATMLRELLATRAFANTVLESTSQLKTTVKNEAERAAVIDTISKNTKVDANGWRLIVVSYRGTEARPALDIVGSTVTKFKEYYDERIKSQSQNAVAYYENQIKTSTQELEKVNAELRTFLEANQNKVNLDGYGRPLKPEELDYVNLTQRRDIARRQLEEASLGLDRVRASYAAYEKGQDTFLKVQDKPDIQNVSGGRSGQIIVGGAMGLGIGLVVAIVLTVILTLLDRTLRQPGYARQVLGVNRVLDLPNVSSNRGPFNPGFVLRKSLAKQLQAAEARRLRSRNP